MRYLVGDIGNTSTKICILNNKFKITKFFEFETDKIYDASYLRIILKNYLNKDLNPNFLFSSVVPSVFKEIKKKFKSKKYKFFEIKDFNLRKIIKIHT